MHQWRSERQAIYRMAMPIDTAQRVVKSTPTVTETETETETWT